MSERKDSPMTDLSKKGRAKLRAICNAATDGPISWFGNEYKMHLATIHRGRQFIMGFKRWGMRGAEPTFQHNGRMIPASELVRFDVARDVQGMSAGKASEKVDRYDFSVIDHPDAKRIAAAYDALPACLDRIEAQEAEITDLNEALDLAKAAIKALSETEGAEG